ncbi:MAG: hypothetical protein KGO53_03085 [Alphaproteobacteria bacterium]|nr:hypothetical protein [Alphaproteobacteria bacterium]
MHHRWVIMPAFAWMLACAPHALGQSVQAPQGKAIAGDYKQQFANCDATDAFDGVQLPIKNAAGKTIWYGCKSDPSRLTRLEQIRSKDGKHTAILWQSKLARDDDGSQKACGGAKGPTDQCTTSLMLDPDASHPCAVPKVGKSKCVPVDAGLIPYAVIPMAAPPGMESGAFSKITGIKVGDYGAVIFNGKTVPVIFADEGPAYKIGEGSAALLAALSNDGKPHTQSSGVVFVACANSADKRKDLKPGTLAATVASKGKACLNAALK